MPLPNKLGLPKICIPSYNRPELLKSKTISFLEQSEYPSELIYIFVSDETERLRYQTVLPGYQLIIGVPGLKAQRKFISDWLQDDEIYLSMDDDIDGVKGKSFLSLISDGMNHLQTRQTGLWGILPKDDARCFKDDTTTHLSFIIGCLFLCRNHKDIVLEGPCETDDYERSILYFLRYGAVYRYRGAGVKTKFLGTSGGSTDTERRKIEAVQGLLLRFPGLCSYRDKGGIADLQLNWRFKILPRV